MEIKQYYSPNSGSRYGTRPSAIVLHSTAGSYAGAVSWLCNGNRPNPSSAHYVIGRQGQIAQLVPETSAAWHVAVGDWNRRSIGIELADDGFRDGSWYTEPQRQALLWICQQIVQRWGIPVDGAHIVAHRVLDPARRSDPVGFDMAAFIQDLQRYMAPAPPIEQPTEAAEDDDDESGFNFILGE